MAGTRKAAILCMMLGDEVAGEVLKYLSDEEVQEICGELTVLQSVPTDISDTVIEEFHELYIGQAYVAQAGFDFTKRLLIRSFGPEMAKRILDRITRTFEDSSGLESLLRANPQQLAKLIQTEHPQTIALVIAHLDASTAADALGYLPESLRAEVIIRMAHLQTISQDVIRRILLVLDQKIKSAGDFSHKVGGVRTAAELCNRLDRDTARRALEEVEAVDPDLALAIRDLMVTFDDLLLVDDTGIREILKYVEKKALAMALKGAVPEIQARFFSNMSSRAVELLKEEMDFAGAVKMKDVSAAQREIVNVLRELDERGVISLSSSSEDYIS